MIRIQQLKLPIEAGPEQIRQQIRRLLRLTPAQTMEWTIRRRSLDARRGRPFSFVYTIDVMAPEEEKIWRALPKKEGLERLQEAPAYHMPEVRRENRPEQPPVVVGFGPAGMFCALLLARAGWEPVILERGRRVEERTRDVERFFREGKLEENSNVQFGEGGAGTFSDGKLNTLVKDRSLRGQFVLEEMVRFGAPEEILYVHKPHVGTDRLKDVVKNIREEILRLGGRFCFETRLTGLIRDGAGGLKAVETERDGVREVIETKTVFLGIGHSARDTFAILRDAGVRMEPKPFAVGLRVEHRQQDIDLAQYRQYAGSPYLGPADYKLTHQTAGGRGVYTFCMCPGGYVIAAASEPGGIVTNGMSNFAREGVNSNSAVLVTVTPEDYRDWQQEYGVLAGVAFQRKLEREAFQLGGSDWSAPVQRWEDFARNRTGDGWGRVEPSYTGRVRPANLRSILPVWMGDALEEGLRAFGTKLEGFDHPDALLTGVESRSSSPVRILRDEKSLQANIAGLYPMGEGAGYAGGIMSAAMDGIRAAEACLSNGENSEIADCILKQN